MRLQSGGEESVVCAQRNQCVTNETDIGYKKVV
jgi:hypothetical protein